MVGGFRTEGRSTAPIPNPTTGFHRGHPADVVRAEGLEPSRALRPNGFSYPTTAFAAPAVFGGVWGLDYPFTVSGYGSGCQVLPV